MIPPANAQARALTDSQGDNAGTTAEQALATLQMISTAGNATWSPAAAGSVDGTFWPETGIYKTAPWATNPGQHTMALIFNANSVMPGAATATATTVYSGTLSGLITPNFTMTSKGFPGNILPNITRDQNLTGTGITQNVFTGIEVERVVAKGIVRQAANYSGDVMQGATKIAEVTDVTFAAVNGATRTFLFRDNAGLRTMTDADNNEYTDYVSALVQKVKVRALLPVTEKDAKKMLDEIGLSTDTPAKGDFVIEPMPEAVLETIVPRLIEAELYHAVLESNASQEAARMVAMRSATDAAKEMTADLTLAYNQLRQQKITQEIAELSAGMAAVAG